MDEPGPFKHILVPADGSEPSINAGRLAIRMATVLRAAVTFLYVVDSITVERMAGAAPRRIDELRQELREKGHTYLEYLMRLARSSGLQTDQVIRFGIPHREIAELARERDVDLIVIGQAGSHWPHPVGIGSVSRRVVESAPCPVLVARQPTARR